MLNMQQPTFLHIERIQQDVDTRTPSHQEREDQVERMEGSNLSAFGILFRRVWSYLRTDAENEFNTVRFIIQFGLLLKTEVPSQRVLAHQVQPMFPSDLTCI